MLVIPYFHIYAFTVGMMGGIWIGALQMILPKYDVEMVLAALRDFRPTFFPAVPTIFVSLLAHPKVKEFDLDQCRTFNSGGAPCPLEVIEEFERRIGRTLNEGYGLSETSPVTHSTPHLARRKPGTIGLAVSRHRHEDRRHRDRHPRDAARRGRRAVHLRAAGDEGLLEQARRSRRSVLRRDDDRPHLVLHRRHRDDGRGRLHAIVQRKKDMIIVDGYNVYPSEVEGVLYTHEGVRMAAVIGIPDAYHGEVVKACVVPRSAEVTIEDLRAHCKANLAAYKVPVEIELRESLPQSAVGKILYRVLRDELKAEAKPLALAMRHEPSGCGSLTSQSGS